MANRVLRDWTDSERIDLLSPEAERMFVRLMMKADDFGYYHANTKLLMSALFPLKIGTISPNVIEAWLDELVKVELVTLYEVENRKYLKINNFGQRLRKMVSKFPQLVSTSPSIDSNPPPESETNPETKQNPEVEDESKNDSTKKDENNPEAQKAEAKPKHTTSKPVHISHADRFRQTVTDQQAVFKFAKAIHKISNFAEMDQHILAHDTGMALSKPEADYKTWIQYFRYYFENLKVNGKSVTIAQPKIDPPYFRKVKFDENGKPIRQ